MDLLDGVDQIGQPLQRKILALHRHNHAVGTAQTVQGEHGQARRAIDQHEVVFMRHSGHSSLDALFAPLHIDQLDLGTRQIAVRTQNIVAAASGDQLVACDAGFCDGSVF